MSLREKSKKLKKRLLIVGLSGSVFLSPIVARAAEDACTPVVKACDKALADQDRVINLKGRVIEAQENIIKAQDVRLTELEKGKGSIFSNPLLYVVLGMVAGGLLVRGK